VGPFVGLLRVAVFANRISVTVAVEPNGRAGIKEENVRKRTLSGVGDGEIRGPPWCTVYALVTALLY